jgi:hypothetical protein
VPRSGLRVIHRLVQRLGGGQLSRPFRKNVGVGPGSGKVETCADRQFELIELPLLYLNAKLAAVSRFEVQRDNRTDKFLADETAGELVFTAHRFGGDSNSVRAHDKTYLRAN